jgi:5-methylcytosine-specific restriction protein B
VTVEWDTAYAKEIEPQKRWGVVTVDEVSGALAAIILEGGSATQASEGVAAGVVEPVFRDVADALERKGQVILYGPPGTGKTYTARRFATWWLQGEPASASELLSNQSLFAEAERTVSEASSERRYWWIVGSPAKGWRWDMLFDEGTVDYSYGRLRRNFPLVRPGDLVFGYQSTPDKKLVALARVSRGLETREGKQTIALEPLLKIDNGLTYDELLADPILKSSEPIRFRNQGTLFALTNEEAEHCLALLTERQPAIGDVTSEPRVEQGAGALTWITFHPSYSYEDFIEGFRPIDTGSGQLVLRLTDGVFKRICREAQANPDRRFLVFIDEINRANVAKVFGELITLLEKDKRGLTVMLPQSHEPFMIPANVFVVGTMNTADRSIKLLDAALRRRFAFVELMPDASVLAGVTIGSLKLDDFLDELNRRVAQREGREKQVGHSFFFDPTGVPISEPEDLALVFRQEILPLLQEYCYDDYATLAEYVGSKIVDKQRQVLDMTVLGDPDSLLSALEEEFNAPTPSA